MELGAPNCLRRWGAGRGDRRLEQQLRLPLLRRGTVDAQRECHMTTQDAADIEVGQVADPTVKCGGGLRLWRAREAMRQAELRLAAQAAALTTLEGRAQALVGWAAAAITALVGALFLTSAPQQLRIAAAGGAIAMAIALVFALKALAPMTWAVVGHDPIEILDANRDAELYDVEAMARGYSAGIAVNSARLTLASSRLNNSLCAVAYAPVTALVGAVLGVCALALMGALA